MATIVIEQGFQPGFSREELEALAEAMRGTASGCEIEIEWYKHDRLVLYDLPELTREVFTVRVPWEAVTGAAATIVLESIREWLADRFRDRKDNRDAELAAAKETAEEPYPYEPRPILQQEVRILGPKGQLLGIVYTDANVDKPASVTGNDAADYEATNSRRRYMG